MIDFTPHGNRTTGLRPASSGDPMMESFPNASGWDTDLPKASSGDPVIDSFHTASESAAGIP